MYLYDFATENREIVRLIYTLVVGLVCLIIVLRTDKLFRLSLYQGIRYFRNAFLFYGLAFILRYLLGAIYIFSNFDIVYLRAMRIVFEFFLIMAGFFLIYSLFWKKFEAGRKSFSSLFNIRIVIFYALTLILVILDYLWKTYFFMFSSQIFLFSCASVISYINYTENKKTKFLRLYFIVMVLNLITWILNFIVAGFFEWSRNGVIGIYILNLAVFLIFLYGVIKTTQK